MGGHRFALGGGWAVWRAVELRSAGFPAAIVEGLADEALARAADAGDRLDDAFTRAQRAASQYLRGLARQPAFREAVTWQNRRVVHEGIDSLLRQPEGSTNTKTRQKEQLVASYAQRYGCKNERVSFFGASVPARIVDAGPALAVRPGDRLIAERATYLEPWAIDALADRLAAEPALRPHLRPRRLPTIRLDGDVLVHGGDRRTPLPLPYARVLAACDGATPAHELAARVLAMPDLELATADDVYGLLDDLVAEGVLLWTLEVPTKGGPPERLLRAALAQIADGPARARGIAALDELEHARDRVAAAAGSAPDLDAAIDDLQRTFVALTGHDSVRHHGEAYAGRTIVGEDCVRDVEVVFGPPLIARLAGPLQLVLQSARWYTYEIARRYRAAFGALYRELRGDGAAAVAYARLYARLPELFPADGAASIVTQVAGELQARWREILAFADGERRVERTADALRAGIARAFAAPHPGWPAARHHSPDVLLAGAGVDAINRGDFLAVLGEIHAGMCSLLVPEVPNAERDPDAPFALRDLDVPAPGVAPVWSRRRSRLDYYSRSPRDYDVEVGPARSWRERAHVLALADLVIEERDGALGVRTRDGRVGFDVIAFHEHYLLANSFSAFRLLGGPHTPRVTVDGVVLVRERWVVAASDLPFAHAREASARFVQARACARALGLPRRVFIKIPEETKPLFVDFASPTYVELAAKSVRKASTVAIAEMLPDLDDLWLTDRAGQRYTSELRIVAVDPEPWVPPGDGWTDRP